MATVKIRLRPLLDQKMKRDGRELITHEELAATLGLARPTISAWMRDKVDRLDKETIVKFCEYLECDVSDLLVLER